MWTLVVMKFVLTGAFLTYEVATYKKYDDCIVNLFSVRQQLKYQETLENQFVVACKNFDAV
jgi:hypothetical protein